MVTTLSEHIPPQFNPGHNWAYLILLFILSYVAWWDYASSEPLERLSDPVSAVADSLGPELEYYDGLKVLPHWQQLALNFPGFTRNEFVTEAIKTWQDVLITIRKDPGYFSEDEIQIAQAYLFILLAEETGYTTALDESNQWPSTESALIQYIKSAYGEQKILEQPAHSFFDTYPENWTTLRLLKKSAQVRGSQQALDLVNLKIKQQTDSQISRTIIYAFFWWSILIGGLLLFLFYARKILITDNRYQVAWPVGDALGVYIRVEIVIALLLIAQTFWYGISAYLTIIEPVFDAIYSWTSLFSGLITIFFVYYFLCKPRHKSFQDVFGLSLSRINGLLPLFIWVIVLISLDNIGIIIINQIAYGLGVNTSWTEGISETLLWGSTFEVSLDAIDTVLWAPIYEELIFRGVLYLGLRQYCSPVVAAILSASVFSFLHFYSVIGFIEILWGGLLYALAFEYSRSLLPAIGAHMLFNLHWLLYSLIFYRL